MTNIGFVFFPEHWEKGYATESLLAIISFLSTNGICFMRATVATPNIASSSVLIKAGFTRGELVPDERDTYEYNLKIRKH